MQSGIPYPATRDQLIDYARTYTNQGQVGHALHQAIALTPVPRVFLRSTPGGRSRIIDPLAGRALTLMSLWDPGGLDELGTGGGQGEGESGSVRAEWCRHEAPAHQLLMAVC